IDETVRISKQRKELDKKIAKEREKELKIIADNLKENIKEIFSEDVDLFPEKTQERSKKYFYDIISGLEKVVQNVEIGGERYIYLNNQIEKTKKLLEQVLLTEEQITEMSKKSTDSIIKDKFKEQDIINKKYFENLEVSKKASEEEIEIEKQKKQDRILIAKASSDALFSITQGISDFRKQTLDNELASGLISEKKYQEELKKIKRQEAIANKAQAVFNIGISIAEAIVKALAAGPVVGQVLAGITAALGFAQLAFVLATPLPKFKKGGQVSEKLGLIKGKSHSQGGVPIEVEGEEYVMPVEETRKNIKALKAIHEGKFDKLFVPRENLIQPDIFANIPNPANIDSSILVDKEDYSSINSRLDKVASELYWLTNETKKGNKSRERGTEKVVKTLQNKSKRYV
ncbi:MAG TPA: hypothetical protein PLS10_08775, partial [Chitinophagales bacterium]|nr:hypothetical protein [Chitinophagales bacterium]